MTVAVHYIQQCCFTLLTGVDAEGPLEVDIEQGAKQNKGCKGCSGKA